MTYRNRYEVVTCGEELPDVCLGFSGAPAFILRDEGTLAIVGVASRGVDHFVDPCGAGGIWTRVSPYISWINKYLNS